MPTDWTYHADGVKTAVTTKHQLDGRLKSVRLNLDCFKVRSWTEEEIEESTREKEHLVYDEKEDVWEDYADGSHAILRFSVDGGNATLKSIEPKDGGRVKPRHIAILPAAERVVEQLDEVDTCYSTIETLANAYHQAGEVYIDKLDG